MRTIIINGAMITHDKTHEVEILIENNHIIQIGENLDRCNAKIIDAAGMYVLPGAVDLHTNLALGADNTFSKAAFKQNSLSALYGGTTTIIENLDYFAQNSNKRSNTCISHAAKELENNSYIDYSFHRPYKEKIPTEESLDTICNGFPSFTISMSGNHNTSDEDILDLVRVCTPYGGTTFIHPESNTPIKLLEELHTIKKRTAPLALASTRPNWTESEAILRMINLTRAGNVTIVLNPVTCKESLDILSSLVTEGLPITVLTNPHYLTLSTDKYLSNESFDPNTYKYCVQPPLRNGKDVDNLWKAINAGLVHCISSGHVGVHLTHKLNYKDDIFNVPVGVPGAELRLSLLHTFGVLTGKITINKLVEITATHVTRIAGLRTKGRIEAGTDADIVIFDPNKKKTITKDVLHDSCDYTPYEGMELQGFAKHVFLKGKHVIKDFSLNIEEPTGELTFRKAVAMR